MQLEVALPVENHLGHVTARFHWNFATKSKQAFGVAFQKDLNASGILVLKGLARRQPDPFVAVDQGTIGRLHRSGAAPFAHSRSNGVRLVQKGGQADAYAAVFPARPARPTRASSEAQKKFGALGQ